jgi:ABC-type amino acid transport substrate-binding protein
MRTLLIILVSVLLSVAATVVYLQSKEMGGTVVATPNSSAYDQVIKMGTLRCGYAPWPPFIVKDPNTGTMSGILYDIVEEIGKQLDLKIDWNYETGYGNYTEDLNMNRFDVMCATLWADAGRTQNSLLIDPFLYSGVYLVVRADDTRFDQNFSLLNDEAMTVTGVDGDITMTLGNKLFPKSQKVFLSNTATASEMAENVKTGKADAMFADLGFFNDYSKANPDKLKILLQNPAWVFGERMAVKTGEWQLKYMLDTAIAEIVNSGRVEEIMAKYPGTSTVAPTKTFDGLPNN